MPRRRINGVELYYRLSGSGEPLVLVHGSWTDHASWRFVYDRLAQTHRVLAYDRRGHSRSERPGGPGSRRADEDDLAGLIEALDVAPAHLVGTSYGASIALGLGHRRPDLVRSVIAHEPPLIGIARPGSDLDDLVQPIRIIIIEVADALRGGAVEGGVRRFIEEAVLGPGSWPAFPPEARQTMIANAPTFLAMLDDPHWSAAPDPTEPAIPVLLTAGDASPAWLPAIVHELARTTHRQAAHHAFPAAGHAPHLSHPAEHVDLVRTFTRRPQSSVRPVRSG